MKIPPIVPYTAAVVGGWVIYCAVRNESPVAVLRSILSGNPAGTVELNPAASSSSTTAAGFATSDETDFPNAGASEKPAVGDGTSRPYTGSVSNVPVDHYDSHGHPVPVLVTVQGRHKLAPVAATAFQALQAATGFPIQLTGAWRPIPTEGGPYRGHHSGEAIDIAQGLTGLDPFKQPGDPRRDKWDRFVKAAAQTGWANWTLDATGRPRDGVKAETWHWSYNGRH